MSDYFKTITQDKSETRANTEWFRGRVEFCSPRTYILEDGAVSGNYIGKVKGGTVVGINSSTKKAHPCGHAVYTAPVTSDTLPVNDTRGFRVGETVDAVDAGGTPISAGLTILAIDQGALTIQVSASITVAAGDQLIRPDGSETPVGISLYDSNTWTGQSDENGNPIHGLAPPIRVLTSGDWAVEAKVINMSSFSKTTLEGLGFKFE